MLSWKSVVGSTLLALSLAAAPVLTLAEDLPQTQQGGVDLLAPLGNQTNIPVSSGFGTVLAYFNDAAWWLVYVAMGVCVWQVLQGGFAIMLSGAFSSQREKGKSKMIWAILGIVILLFAGTILRMLNSLFFK